MLNTLGGNKTMTEKMKHRIIGGVVILALIVIIVPMLMQSGSSNKTAKQQLAMQANIPTPPQPNATAKTTAPQKILSAQQNTQKLQEPTTQRIAANIPVPAQAQAVINKRIAHDRALAAGKIKQAHTIKVVVNGKTEHIAPAKTQAQVQAQHIKTMEHVAHAQPLATLPASYITNKTTVAANHVKPIVKNVVANKPVILKRPAPKAMRHAMHAKKQAVWQPPAVQELTQAYLKTGAWAVQLGSFRDHQNAKRLASRLQKQGFHVFTHQLHDKDKLLQVFVGPKTTARQAHALLVRLNHITHLQGIVVSTKH